MNDSPPLRVKRRIFIAIPIPENIRQQAVNWQEAHAKFASGLMLHWIKPENLHVTLVPPWFVTEDQLSATIEVAGEICAAARPLYLKFHKIIFGPPRSAAHLIWTEGETAPAFIELKTALERRLMRLPETGLRTAPRREPKPHLTLARMQPVAQPRLPRLEDQISWEFTADEIALMQSKLKRSGAEYTILQKFPIFNSQFSKSGN